MAYQNQNKVSNYVRSSSFVKNLIYDSADESTAPHKERVGLEAGVTEEIGFSLTADKAEDLISKIQAAINDPQGDGGIRITMFCKKGSNNQTGEEFDGLSLIVSGKFPPKGKSGGGSFNRGKGNGQRSFGQSNRGTNTSYGQRPNRTASQAPRGAQTNGGTVGGPTVQPQTTSPSNAGGYSDDTGW